MSSFTVNNVHPSPAIVVRFRVSRRLRFRLWLGKTLIDLGIWIIGGSTETETV